MSVSPPPGLGPGELCTAVGTAPGLMSRNVGALSTEPSHSLRWVPVPVGPLANTSFRGASKLIDGSPKVWIGSTTVGTENVILPDDRPADAGLAELLGLLRDTA